MTEQEYRKAKGINYSSLGQFAISQDHCLIPFKGKSYFEHGKMFESLLQDVCKNTTTFSNKYFSCDISGSMPDNLIYLIESGADLETEIKYNKDGVTRSGIHKTKHAYIDACLENPGKFPVNETDMDMLNAMCDNMLKCELLGEKMANILANCEWQVPIFWEKDGLKKKALVDCLLDIDDRNIIIDIKTSATLSNFYNMARKKYYIQDVHYSEGVTETTGKESDFYFLVSGKDSPYLSRPFNLIQNTGTLERYNKLCVDYSSWIESGKPEKGYLELTEIEL